MHLRFLIVTTVALIAAGLALTSLQAATPAAPAVVYNAPPGDFLRVHSSMPATLDPATASTQNELRLVVQVFEGLVRLDENHEPQTALASSWMVAPDESVFTFTLRTAYFSNGRQVVAADVVTSLMRLISPTLNAPYAYILDDVQGALAYRTGNIATPVGIQALDSGTVRFTLLGTRPPQLFLRKLSLWAASVVPIEQVDAGGAAWWQNPARYVGAGPFKVIEFVSNTRIVLAANPLYYTGPPALSGVAFHFIPNLNEAFNAYLANQLDVFSPSPSQGMSITLAGIRSQYYTDTAINTTYASLDNQKAPFTGANGLKLRQAFNYALDKTLLISTALGNFAEPAKGVLPPTNYGYNPALQGLDFNVVSATQRLAESGYAGSPPIVMYTAPAGRPVMENVRDQIFANLGISATITTSLAANYQVGRFGWMADYPDPENWLPVLLRSGAVFNRTHYSNPAFDALVDQAAQTVTETERIDLYRQAEQLAVSEAALLPLYHARTAMLVKPWVKGPVILDWNWSRPYTNLRIESAVVVTSGVLLTFTADANVVLEFPAGALTQTATISYTALATRPLGLAGGYDSIGYTFDLDGVYSDGVPVKAFQQPVTLTVYYTTAQPVREDTFALFSLKGGIWQPAETCAGPWIDTNANIFRVALCHFSKYTLAGQTDRLFLPLIRR